MSKKKTKKAPHKSKRRKYIIGTIVIVVLGFLIYSVNKAASEREVELKDKEKFALLDRKTAELADRLNVAAGQELWTRTKSCSKPGIKFYQGTAGGCAVEVFMRDDTAAEYETTIASVRSIIGKTTEVGHSEFSKKHYLSFNEPIKGIYCTFYYNRNQLGELVEGNLSCHGSSLDMYYQEGS